MYLPLLFLAACELAAKFYLGIGELQMSLQHFTLAHEKYSSWGAIGKAEKLFLYTNEKFTSLLTGKRPSGTGM
jgi:hypothetical protein